MSPALVVAGGLGLVGLFFAAARANRSDGIDVRVGPAPGAGDDTPPMNAELLAAMVAATRSGSAFEMRRVAGVLRAAGYPLQAAELERAAREINNRARRPREEAPSSGTPVTEVDEVPPGAVPVRGAPGDLATTQPVDDDDIEEVDEVPPDAVPVPSTPTDEQRRIPPSTDQLSADYARMTYASAPRGPVKDLALSEAFKTAKNVRGQPKFYGQGPALALIKAGVVPATPWDWQQSDPTADKASYRRQLGEAKRNDPARADLWDQAIAAVR